MIDPGQYNFMLNSGYVFRMSQKFKLLPSALVILTPHRDILFDINGSVSYADRFYFGISYRNSRSVAGLFQFQINSQLKVAYTYDFDTGQLGKYSNGSHEIMLKYEFKYKADIVNPLIF
jgi:type IX secretion system PorP/SprF family membrane protein